MFDSLRNFFGGKKITETVVPIREGKLKVILKQRIGQRYLFLRFSYPGNVQYHILHKEDVDQVIEILTKYRSEM